MKTLINIKADKEVKKRAQKVAYELGIPLSTIINAYLKQFIHTKEIHFYTEGRLKAAAKKRLERLSKDVQEGKNLSPAFDSAEKAILYLNSR